MENQPVTCNTIIEALDKWITSFEASILETFSIFQSKCIEIVSIPDTSGEQKV